MLCFLCFLIASFMFLLFYKPIETFLSSPPGQVVSEVPLSDSCLLDMYLSSCCGKEKKSINKRKNKGKHTINLTVPGFYPRQDSRCYHLSIRDCLATPGCGWLAESGDMGLSTTDSFHHHGQCYPGTPIGPIYPRLQPIAEDSQRKNIQLDRWKYAHPNPFVGQ